MLGVVLKGETSRKEYKVRFRAYISACQQIRDSCNLSNLKDTLATFKLSLRLLKLKPVFIKKDTDKWLNESSDEIRALRKDISEIKEGRARTNTLLETSLESIKKQNS